jgi:putative two-component system response regulator
VESTNANDRSAGRVLVVDDMEANRRLVASVLKRDGYTVGFAAGGRDALDVVARDQPDLVLMDVMMPGVDGFAACAALKADQRTRLVPVVLLTALRHTEDRIRGLDAGADDFLSKPVNPHELRARVRSLIRLKRHTDDLESAESVIVSLALTIEARDRSTKGHCERLAVYASLLGASLGLSDDDIAALERGGFLHDIGKVGVPDAILLKRGRLTPAEYETMKRHTEIGDRLCTELRSLRRVSPIVRHHHERLDGTGYPDGLHGDAIPLLAQITGIVDVFDALTTERPYKLALPADNAFDELRRDVQRGWRRGDLVEAFITLARRDGFTRALRERAG